MGKFCNLQGQKFGKLTVVEYVGNSYWLTKCECGQDKVVHSYLLKTGKTKSCGCLHKEISCKNSRKHGQTKSSLYMRWIDMLRRCYQPHNKGYHNYGGRGITVCDEWLNDFQAFYDWAYANGYNPNAKRGECTLDRIDVNGNYEPSNCRWVDMKAQSNNTRRNHILVIGNEEKNIGQWAEEKGMNYSTLNERIRRGWNDVTAVTTPITDKYYSKSLRERRVIAK